MTDRAGVADLTLDDLRLCFEGAVPAVIATAAADGTPNVTYLSRVQQVDAERVALSNQFLSKSAANLAGNPRASVLLIEPTTCDQYRLAMVYERTARRGPVFERLRADIESLAALEGMQDVFRLRAADIYRVVAIDVIPARDQATDATDVAPPPVRGPKAEALAELAMRLSRCGDLDALLTTTVDGLAELFGYHHSLVLLLDEDGRRLATIASRGYESGGVGSEVVVGEGIVGMTAARCAPVRIGNLRQMSKYSHTMRRSYEGSGAIGPGRDIPVPWLPESQSLVAVPAMAHGELVGVLMIESPEVVAFTAEDQAVLNVVATLVANAVESERSQDRAEEHLRKAPPPAVPVVPTPTGPAVHLRFFAVDGSTFLDGEYLIKGVAGRILWALVGQFERDGRVDFTNRELRLDAALDLPPFRDNLENRLLVLQRRLDERHASVRIEKSGRGRFRLRVTAPLRLERVDS